MGMKLQERKKMKVERNENDPIEKRILDCNSLSTNRTFSSQTCMLNNGSVFAY